MIVRWRKLVARRDPEAFRDAFADVQKTMQEHRVLPISHVTDAPIAAAAAVVAAEVAGPRQVDAEERQGTLEELARLLREKALSLDDLTNDGSGWVTLRDFAPLADEVEARARRRTGEVGDAGARRRRAGRHGLRPGAPDAAPHGPLKRGAEAAASAV